MAGWGPVSNYKPGGGGVNYLNHHKGTIQNKYQEVWQANSKAINGFTTSVPK